MKIKDLDPEASLGGVRFHYPGSENAPEGDYYWFSQWNMGVWGKVNMADTQIHPLFVDDLQEAMEWEVVP